MDLRVVALGSGLCPVPRTPGVWGMMTLVLDEGGGSLSPLVSQSIVRRAEVQWIRTLFLGFASTAAEGAYMSLKSYSL